MNKIKQEEQLKKQAETIQRLNAEIEEYKAESLVDDKYILKVEIELWDAMKALERIYQTPWYMPWEVKQIARKAIYGSKEANRQREAE